MLLATETGRIHFVSDTFEGSVHDKAIADENPYPLPSGSELLQDLGFQGFLLEHVRIIQPEKKQPRKPVSDEQKAANRFVAHCRVRMEHIIVSSPKPLGEHLFDRAQLFRSSTGSRYIGINPLPVVTVLENSLHFACAWHRTGVSSSGFGEDTYHL